MKVFEALQKMKDNTPEDATFGICSNLIYLLKNEPTIDMTTIVEYFYNHWDGKRYEAFEQWEHFSGNHEYPVEGDHKEYFATIESHWDKETKYGVLRWELLDHLIDWFKKKDI